MGGDGGTITNDRKFVRGIYKSDEDKGKNLTQHQVLRSKLCAQSNQKLCEPIVACEMGNLYNKEAMLTALIDKTLNPTHAHIRGLKDLKTLRFTPNPTVVADNDEEVPMFTCPVTGLLLNGIHPFVVIWTTGWVLSEKAIRELGIDALQPEYGPFGINDVIKLIPGEEEFVTQRTNMETRREATKSEKKNDSKKNKRSTTGVDNHDTTTNEHKKVKKHENPYVASSSSSSAGGSSSNGNVVASRSNLTAASSLAKQVVEAVSKQEESNTLFAGLFHHGREADKKDKDLFMTVAGLRYST